MKWCVFHKSQGWVHVPPQLVWSVTIEDMTSGRCGVMHAPKLYVFMLQRAQCSITHTPAVYNNVHTYSNMSACACHRYKFWQQYQAGDAPTANSRVLYDMAGARSSGGALSPASPGGSPQARGHRHPNLAGTTVAGWVSWCLDWCHGCCMAGGWGLYNREETSSIDCIVWPAMCNPELHDRIHTAAVRPMLEASSF